MSEPRLKCDDDDTLLDGLRIEPEICRRIPFARRWQVIADLYEMGRELVMARLRIRHPEASEEEIWHLWARQHLGDELYEEVYRNRDGFQPSK